MLFHGWTHLPDGRWGHKLTAKHEFLHGARPPAAVAGHNPAVPAPWEALGSRCRRGRDPGHALQVLLTLSQTGTRGQCRPSLIPIPWIPTSANPAHHKAQFQSNASLSWTLTLVLLLWLRTLSPENLMGHLSGLKQSTDGAVLLGQDICLSCELTFTEQHWIPSRKEQAKKGVKTNEGRRYAFWRQNNFKELILLLNP